MQQKLAQNFKFQELLKFNEQINFDRAMTFKQYQQEYAARNKDSPLLQGINEVLIDIGQELLAFFFFEYLIFQGYPRADSQIFPSFSKIHQSKQTLFTDDKLAELSSLVGIISKMLLTVNQTTPLREIPKIQAYALKALVGAHYFDKQKDLNKLRKLLAPLYEEMLKNLKLEQQPPQPIINYKGDFQEYMSSTNHKFELYYQLIQEEIKLPFDTEKTYRMEILINGRIPIEKKGVPKKEVERQLYRDAARLIKDPNFETMLLKNFPKKGNDDSWQSDLQETFSTVSSKPQVESVVSSKWSNSQAQESYLQEKDEGILEELEEKLKYKKFVSESLAKYND